MSISLIPEIKYTRKAKNKRVFKNQCKNVYGRIKKKHLKYIHLTSKIDIKIQDHESFKT